MNFQSSTVNMSREQIIDTYLADRFGCSTNTFDPMVLKSGTEEQKRQQLKLWLKSPNLSVFVRWVPDELLPSNLHNPDDLVARSFFGQFGSVSRIDFVPKFNASNKPSGHMAFVHYDKMYNTTFQEDIADCHPEPYAVDWRTRTRNGEKVYTLKCCVNIRSVPKVEFNPSQLTDMIQLLNARLTTETMNHRSMVDSLVEEINALKSQVWFMQMRMDPPPPPSEPTTTDVDAPTNVENDERV